MRLSEVMSRPITGEFYQVDSFLGKTKLGFGKNRKINVGKVGLNFYCKECQSERTFCTGEELVCVGVNERLISIDCALKCSVCDSNVQMWFLIEFEGDMLSRSPSVRVLNKFEKLSEYVLISRERYGELSDLLEKAETAFRVGLGAGSVVYLRKIFERITIKTANVLQIDYPKYESGNPKNFSDLLKKVDEEASIIPKEFSNDGYRLFRELSGVVHGNSNEEDAIENYRAFYRLVTGILDSVKNNEEIMDAIGKLGWNNGGESGE